MTTVAAAPHVVVAHHLIGMCHYGIGPGERLRAVHRARQLADTLDRGAWLLLIVWATGQPTNKVHALIPRVQDCLDGIAMSSAADLFDGLDHDGHAPDKTERAYQARGVGRTPPEAA